MPDSVFMIHHGKLGLPMEEEETTYSCIDFHRDTYGIRKRMLDVYVNALKHEGIYKDDTPEDIEKMLLEMMMKKNDAWFTERAAVEAGFADLVWDDYDEDKLFEYTPDDFKRNDDFKPRYK